MSGTWADLIRSTDSMWDSTTSSPAPNQGVFTRAAMEQILQANVQRERNDFYEWYIRAVELLLNNPSSFYGALSNSPLRRKWPELLDLPRGA